MLYGSIRVAPELPGGIHMTPVWALVIAFGFGAMVTYWVLDRRSAQRAQLDALGPGAIVFVRTSDGQRLLARVISRGPSHFWIELTPGDARWWVPATAVEPASERAKRAGWFKSVLGNAPRGSALER
jgi:hypothetical protein